MSKHTPGPWAVVINYGDLTVRSANERDTKDETYLEIVERVGGLRVGPELNRSEEVANAHLIAAAPELLEALIGLVDCDRTTNELWEQARAAIAKATGE